MPTVPRGQARKTSVIIPTEPSQICQWNDESIKASSDPKHYNGVLLTQDLYSASSDIYQSNKINNLGQIQTSYFDETNLTLTKKKNTNLALSRRFIVDVGHKKYHEDNFKNRQTYKSDNEYHESFRKMIQSHYQWCFNNDEQPFIEKAIDRDNVCHIVIYNRYYRRLQRNKEQFEPYYFVAAAASFVISDTCSVLMYMGVSGDLFLPKSDFIQADSLGSNKKLELKYRQQDLGAYMISMIQKMTYCVTGHHTIVAQVKNHSLHGAVYFYLRLYFKIVSPDHNQVYETKAKFDDIFQEAPGLVYMISRCPLYTIYPNFMNNLVHMECMKVAIQHGAKTILNKNLENDLKCSSILANELTQISSKLTNEDKAYICWLPDTYTDQISLTQEPYSTNGNDDTLIFPKIDFYERFLHSNQLNIVQPFYKDPIKNLNINYKVMAIILYQDEYRFPDIRCFFYYIFHCLEFMSIEKCNLYNTNINDKKIRNFQRSIWETILFCEKKYSYLELKKYNLPGSKDEAMEISTPTDLYNAIRYIKTKQLQPSYPGTDLEWSIFCSIFGVDIQLFHAYSLEKKGMNISNNQRQWIIKKKIPNEEDDKYIFNFFVKSVINYVLPCIVYDNNYLMVGNDDILKNLELKETVINYKISCWMNHRPDKFFFPGCPELDYGPYKLRKESFFFNDYTHPSLSLIKRCVITLMMDPLERWVSGNIIYIKKNGLSALNYLTLRPTTYISSAILDCYIDYLNTKHEAAKSILIKVSELSHYSYNTNTQTKLEEKVSKFKHIICPICIDNNHWISAEFKYTGKKGSSVEIFIADSNYLNNENLLLQYDNIKKAASNFFMFVTRLSVNAKLHPVISEEMGISERNSTWYDFYEKVCKIKQAAYIITQDNSHDCGVCCLQRMGRILTSSNHSAEPHKNTPEELLLPTRQFRLIMLNNLIPNDLSEVFLELKNFVEDKVNQIVLPDVHEQGVNDTDIEHCMESFSINLKASLLKGSLLPLPMDNYVEDTQIINEFPIENDVITNLSENINVPIENDIEKIIEPYTDIDPPLDRGNKQSNIALSEWNKTTDNDITEKDTMNEDDWNKTTETIDTTEKDTMNEDDGSNSPSFFFDMDNDDKVNNELESVAFYEDNNDDTVYGHDVPVKGAKTPRLEHESLRIAGYENAEDDDDPSDDGSSFLPKGNGGIIRTDLNDDENEGNVSEDDNNDDDNSNNAVENTDQDNINQLDNVTNITNVSANKEQNNNIQLEGTLIQNVIDKYDANVDVNPQEVGIDLLPNSTMEELIKKRKIQLPKPKQKYL